MNPLVWISNKLMRRPTCEEINRFLAEYVEGALATETHDKFEKHIRLCSCCGSYLDDYRMTIEMAKNSRDIKVPDALIDHTIEFLRTRMKDA